MLNTCIHIKGHHQGLVFNLVTHIMMFKQVIFALFISIAFVDFANGTCRDITLDACDYGDNGPFETLKGIA